MGTGLPRNNINARSNLENRACFLIIWIDFPSKTFQFDRVRRFRNVHIQAVCFRQQGSFRIEDPSPALSHASSTLSGFADNFQWFSDGYIFPIAEFELGSEHEARRESSHVDAAGGLVQNSSYDPSMQDSGIALIQFRCGEFDIYLAGSSFVKFQVQAKWVFPTTDEAAARVSLFLH